MSWWIGWKRRSKQQISKSANQQISKWTRDTSARITDVPICGFVDSLIGELTMQVRQARIADVPGIAALVDRFAGRGEILPRPVEEIYQSVREWVVAERAGQIVGCGALVILWADMAEIRSLVVAPEAQGMGLGSNLVAALMGQAAALDLPEVIALTRKPGFFLKLGFRVVPRESLPRKIWKDCVTCTKFVGCDEVAVTRPVGEIGGMEGWKVGRLRPEAQPEGLEDWKVGRLRPEAQPEGLEDWIGAADATDATNSPVYPSTSLPAYQSSNLRGPCRKGGS
jgi:amino-acid N-acetyltransferase